MPARQLFDQKYYQRFYYNVKSRVADQKAVNLITDYLSSFIKYASIPVRSILDVGCGTGMWRKALKQRIPKATYEGIEISEYLCQRYGWKNASIVDFVSQRKYDLVICSGVLPYLSHRAARAAIDNLGRLCRSALYLQAATREDWDSVCNRRLSDPQMYLRRADWYRRQLEPHFIQVGGGLWLPRNSPTLLYALERS